MNQEKSLHFLSAISIQTLFLRWQWGDVSVWCREGVLVCCVRWVILLFSSIHPCSYWAEVTILFYLLFPIYISAQFCHKNQQPQFSEPCTKNLIPSQNRKSWSSCLIKFFRSVFFPPAKDNEYAVILHTYLPITSHFCTAGEILLWAGKFRVQDQKSRAWVASALHRYCMCGTATCYEI